MKSTDRFNASIADSTGESVKFRSLRSPEEYQACMELQREVWGEDFKEVVHASFVKVSQKIGGIGAGAFDAHDRLVGFVFGMTGIEDGDPVHWSHMLAVRKEARDRGIGRRLKLFQREALVQLGVERMYWTFDPLVARNAHLNLNRLAADVREYVPNMYGDTGSKLHSHGTDRFVVAWRLSDPTVSAVLEGESVARPLPGIDGAPVVNTEDGGDGHPQPSERTLGEEPVVLVEIPNDSQEMQAVSPGIIGQWQTANRRAFAWYLERRYTVAGFHRRDGDGRCFYVLAAGSV